MQITILNTAVTDKGKYKELDVAFKDNEGKTSGKKIMSFSQKETFSTLANASSGEVYDVKPVKNDKGYWDWVDAKKVDAGARSAEGSAVARTAPKSTYETPEERMQKQVYIVRQSSLSNAIEYLKANNPKGGFDEASVIGIAKTFEDYVFNKLNKPTDGGLSEMDDDIPL